MPVFPLDGRDPVERLERRHQGPQACAARRWHRPKVVEDERGEPIGITRGWRSTRSGKACGSLLLAQGKNLKQVQGWLRHSQLTTTLNVYIHDVDDGLGGADAWDTMLSLESGPVAPRVAPERRQEALRNQETSQ